MAVCSVRHSWSEKRGFIIDRPNGYPAHTFINFISATQLTVDGKSFDPRPHTFIFIPKNTPHFYQSSTALLHNWMHYDDESAALLRNSGIVENLLYTASDSDFITDIIADIEYEFFLNDENSKQMINLKLQELACMICRSQSPHSNMSVHSLDTNGIRNIRREILLHPEKNLSIKSLAAMAGMGESTFHHAYKSIFGITPMQDIILARIHAAENILQRENVHMYELAEQLGYSNEFHFIRQFKQHTGMTPKAYALKHRKGL